MEINVKELEHCKLLVNYIGDAEEILNKRQEILKHFKSAPVPGFRKGKASIEAIKIYYRNQIEESLKRALAEDAYHNTIFEKKFRPLGAPKINSIIMESGKFNCEFEIFVKPEFELAQYRDFEIPKPNQPITALELTEKLLQELRVRHGTSQPYQDNDFVQVGDSLIIDYDGFIDGIKSENLSAQGEMLTIGYSKLEHFDSNLLGMKLNESREFDIVVPLDGLPSFAGKTIRFNVTLKMGSKSIPCPLDDELAKRMNKETFAELKELVAKTAMAKVEEQKIAAIREQIAIRLLNNHNFTAPNMLVVSEAQYLAHNAKLDWTTLADIDKEKYMEFASKNVKLSLILDRIRDEEPEAQISDNEVFDMIKKNLARTKTGANIDDVIKEMNQTGYLQILFARIKDEFALDFVTKTCKIVE